MTIKQLLKKSGAERVQVGYSGGQYLVVLIYWGRHVQWYGDTLQKAMDGALQKSTS